MSWRRSAHTQGFGPCLTWEDLAQLERFKAQKGTVSVDQAPSRVSHDLGSASCHAYSDMMYACCVSKCIELHSNLHGHPGTRVLNTANQLQNRIQVLEAKAWPSQVRSRLKSSRGSTASLAARARLTNQLVVLGSGQALNLIQPGIDRLFITFLAMEDIRFQSAWNIRPCGVQIKHSQDGRI